MRSKRHLQAAAAFCLTALLAAAPIWAQEAKATDAVAPIETARAAVTANSDDATLHLDLARKLAAAIQADPMTKGQLHSAEMLSSLQKAVELDPTLVEAYQYLVGFYLNAPPIAGGSVDKAEALAHQLAEHDADAGKSLLAQVEQRRSNGATSGHP